MSLSTGLLDTLASASELVFHCEFFVPQLSLGRLQLLDLEATSLFVFFSILSELFKLIFLIVEGLGEILDSLA